MKFLKCGNIKKLIEKINKPHEPQLYFVSIEDTFNVIKHAHIANGHGRRVKMIKELSEKYANITQEAPTP